MTRSRSGIARTQPVPISETEFMRQLTQLAELYGWEWMHIRPAVNLRGQWRTAISGTIGKGWPDLVLVRPRDGKLMFVELKAERGVLTADQRHVLDVLACTGAQVASWRPRDWPAIEEALRSGRIPELAALATDSGGRGGGIR